MRLLTAGSFIATPPQSVALREDAADPAELASLPVDIPIFDYQMPFMESRARVAAFVAGVGAGKRLALDTPIATPEGWTTMGRIRVGDRVFDERGRPCRVTYVSPDALGDSYRVRFSDGSDIDADAEHLWLTEDYAARKSIARRSRKVNTDWVASRPQCRALTGPRVRTTAEIAATLTYRHMQNHAVENAAPLRLPAKRLPIDPYLLGYWLGDGSSDCGSLCIGRSDVAAVTKIMRAAGHELLTVLSAFRKPAPMFRVNGLTTKLRAAGLLWRKHVPVAYLRGSIGQRLALLQGLMDTDGSFEASQTIFYNMNRGLADAVYELVVSLGMKATRRRKTAKVNGKDCGDCHCVVFTPTMPVFRIPRKAFRIRSGGPQASRRTRRYIVGVYPIESVPMRCIAVDSPSHLYLAGRSMIPTHNTHVGMAWAGRKMYRERGRGTIGGIFANTNKQLSKATLPKLWGFLETMGFEEKRDFVYNEAPPRSWGGFRSRFKKDHKDVLSVRWWGQAVVWSLENYDAVRGVELGWGAMDETRDTKRAAYDVISARLRCPLCSAHELRITTTPSGFDWLYEEMVEKPSPNREVFFARSADNPSLAADYVPALRESYDPLLAEQELEGKFVSLTAGRAYRNFDRSRHIDGTVAVDPSLDWVISYDFNRAPFSVILIQTLDKGDARFADVRVIDEVRLMDADTASATDAVIDRLTRYLPADHAKRGIRFHVYADPSGQAKTTKGNRSDFDMIRDGFTRAFGDRFVPRWAYYDPGIVTRVNALNALLLSATGRSRIRFHPRCKFTIRDMEQVSYRPGTRELDKTTNRELTHLGDCLCYYAAEAYPAGDAARVGFVR